MMRTLATPRATLEPLTEAHADAMFELLCDPALYQWLDDVPPPSAQALRERYRKLEARGPADGHERWLNWVIRLLAGDALAGYVQATVKPDGRAWIAFVLGTAYQRHGLALEAAQAMIDELHTAYGVHTLMASADVDNAPSIRLLQRLGLREETDAVLRARLGVARGDVLYMSR